MRLGRRAARGLVIEAMVMLVVARLLVALVPFGRWRGWLGEIAALTKESVRPSTPGEARHLVSAVERGAWRLPGRSKCLPQAMALGWMMARRRFAADLVIAVLPGQDRGTLADLHAWIESGGELLIGQSSKPYRPIARFRRTFTPQSGLQP